MLAGLFDQIMSAAEGAADVMDIEGIDPRAFNNLEADLNHDSLPAPAAKTAGAIALLLLLSD